MKKIYTVLGVITAGLLPFVAGAQTFDIASGTATGLTASVTEQLTQPGVLGLVTLAIAIPLFFYIVHQIMGLLPGRRAKRA